MDNPFGNVFKNIERKVKRTKVAIKGRALAQKLSDEYFKDKARHVRVASVKTGVVTLETSGSAMFQEIEGFEKQALLEFLRAGGMNVSVIRARLTSK